ncbi:MAG: DegQ family serine endoprotease [Syntrophales bacterium]|nr:DegQ family serine endoprotease [Syntrophales bacterium]
MQFRAIFIKAWLTLILFICLSVPAFAERPPSFSAIAKKVGPAVVNIYTTQKIRANIWWFEDEFWRRFFGLPYEREREYTRRSLGSGFIISPDGYILTNNHVVARADKIKVKLSSGQEYEAEVKGTDKDTDLALIKIEAKESLPTVVLGDSDKLEVGEWVVAIGNPFGLEHTVTAGIVSAKGRVIGSGPYDNFIQTDASINPGNSGGPLCNLEGEVVGINTAIIAQGQGIGFAVPVNTAKDIISDLKIKGSVTRGWLGISAQDITEEIAKNLGLKTREGALVTEVFPGEPAEKAEMKVGDVIVSVGGIPVTNLRSLLSAVAKQKVGQKVPVEVMRDGQKKTLWVTIGERTEGLKITAGGQKEAEFFGMTVQEVTAQVARELGLKEKKGVIITRVKPGSPADTGGFMERDVIVQINRRPIEKLEDFASEMNRAAKSESLLLLVIREGRALFVTLRPRS